MAEQIIIDRTAGRIRKEAGGRGWQRDFLGYYSLNVVRYEDDFQGDVIKDQWDTDAIGSGTAAAMVLDTVNGAVKIVTGTGDNEGAELDLGSLGFSGELYAVMEARVQVDVLTTSKIEIGFTDAGTVSGGAVNVIAKRTYTQDNAALWIRDSDDTGNANGWQGIGVKATTGITKVEPASNDLAATTWQTLVVALKDDNAMYIIRDANDNQTYDSGWQANAITAATALTPWIF